MTETPGIQVVEPATRPFHNGSEDDRVKTERPKHRIAAFMVARGATREEVADVLGVSKSTVSNWWQTKWFQDLVAAQMQEQGKDIMDLLKSEQIKTFNVLVEMRDNPKVAATVRKSICVDILDRTMGKAVQRFEEVGAGGYSDDPVAEAAQLEQELSTITNLPDRVGSRN